MQTLFGSTIARYRAWRALSPLGLMQWAIGKAIMVTLIFGVLAVLVVEAFTPGAVTAVLQGTAPPASVVPLALATPLPLAGVAAFAVLVTLFPPTGEHDDPDGGSDLFD